MLNPQELNPGFVQALEQSWDERAIWPGCKSDYVPGTSPVCHGQCLAATLNAWLAHGGPDKGYHLIPGIAYGPGLPEQGVWHFQLAKMQPDGSRLPVDVTWHQFQEGCTFKPATFDSNPALFRTIMAGSLLKDDTLVGRVGVISDNLARHGFTPQKTPQEMVEFARRYFQQVIAQNSMQPTSLRTR